MKVMGSCREDPRQVRDWEGPHIAQPEALHEAQDAQLCLETDLQPSCDGEGKVEASNKADSINGNLAANCPLHFSFTSYQGCCPLHNQQSLLSPASSGRKDHFGMLRLAAASRTRLREEEEAARGTVGAL